MRKYPKGRAGALPLLTGPPLTGNLYCDEWTVRGRHYRQYSVDCAGCGRAQVLHPDGRKQTRTRARALGWDLRDESWVCPECLT